MKFLTVLMIASTLLACSARDDDEAQVRAALAAMEEAAEARDASDVLEHVASSYADSRGTDRAELQNFLRGYFLTNPRIEVILDIEQLEIPVAGLAQARVEVTVLPAGDRAVFAVELRREDGQWRVTRADRVTRT
jgi:hypothetical protein